MCIGISMNSKIPITLILIATLLGVAVSGCSSIERKLLYYPTHDSIENGLTRWSKNGILLGYSRSVGSPKNVWLMLHGNGGQASNRAYAIPSFSSEDSVFILEYPGYGAREGTPSGKSLNEAAMSAYLLLRESFPDIPLCVVGESIGSGPASSLATLEHPPDKFVFIVPFDKLSLVAKDHFPSMVVAMVLSDDWDNVLALSNYKGPVDVFGAREDSVIPVAHAKRLSDSIPSSRFFLISGGHNDWSRQGRVAIRNSSRNHQEAKP
jgi:hypothetical protein